MASWNKLEISRNRVEADFGNEKFSDEILPIVNGITMQSGKFIAD